MNVFSLSFFSRVCAPPVAPAPYVLTDTPNRSNPVIGHVLSIGISPDRSLNAIVLSNRSLIEDILSHLRIRVPDGVP